MGKFQEISRKVLDTFPGNAAILDKEGNILQVNNSWISFNKENSGEFSAVAPGVNYLEVCRKAAEEDKAVGASQAVEGIKKVIEGKKDGFKLDYPCHSPEEKRWFMMRVAPLEDAYPSPVVVLHLKITERKLAERELEAKNQRLTQQIERARQIHETMLPARTIDEDRIEASVFYQPAENLGGDFFNFHWKGGKLIFYLVDVSGHGLDGAMLNILVQEKLNNYFETDQSQLAPDYGYQWLLKDKQDLKPLWF